MSKPWEADPTTPWNQDPVAPGMKGMNPEKPWEADPSPATWWKTVKSIPGSVLGVMEKAAGGLVQGMGENDPYAAIGYPVSAAVSSQTKEPMAAVEKKLEKGRMESKPAKIGADIADMGDQQLKESHPGEMDWWQRSFHGGVVSSLTMGPALAASVISRSPAPALAWGAAQSFGSGYADSRIAGSTPEQAAMHGGIDAVAEAALALIPTMYLVDNAGGPVLKTIVGYMAKEVPSEVLTTAVQSANARVRDSAVQGTPFDWKAYGQDMLDTVGATMVAGPISGGMAAGVGRAQASGEKRKMQKDLQLLGQQALEFQMDSDLEIGSTRGARTEQAGGLTGTLSPTYPTQVSDKPTAIVDSTGIEQVQNLIASLDAELIDDAAVEKAKAVVQAHETATKADPEAETSWMGFWAAPTVKEDSSEVGATEKKARNAVNYVNPNVGDRRDWPLLAGPNVEAGSTMRNTKMEAGTYILGQPSLDRSQEYLQAVSESVEFLRQKYLPNATFVISNETLANNSALGSHFMSAPGQHMIVPAVLRNPSQGLDKFNKNDQASAFYNMTHEFGHALIKERFLEGVQAEIASRVVRESEKGLVSEAVIAALPESQQAVVREYNAIKEAVMSNKMTAQQFVEQWLSPAKGQGRNYLAELKVLPTDNAMDVVKAVIARAARRKNITDGAKVKQVREAMTNDFLSLDEYLAEQTARYAYKAGWDKTTALGRFFDGALKSLRSLFVDAKKEGLVQPGTAFTEWIEGLSIGDRLATEKERIATGKKKGKTPAKKKAAAEGGAKKAAKAAPKPTKKVETVEHNVMTDTTEAKIAKGRQLLGQLLRTRVFESTKSPEYREMVEYLENQDWAEFVDAYKRYAGKTVKFELDPKDDFEETLEVGMESDIESMIAITGQNMYSGETPALIVKELVQNSFDAIKSLLYNNQATEGTITVEISPSTRTISVIDDGIGMDKETMLKALLRYPGTSKPGLPPEESSGGFGQAKQLFIYTPESIRVETVQDGRRIVLTGTPAEIAKKKAKMVITAAPGEKSGTRVTVVMPEFVEKAGKKVPVVIKEWKHSYEVLSNPPLYEGVKIIFQNLDIQPGTWTFGPQEIENPLKTHKLLKTVQAAWGQMDIYLGPIKEDEFRNNAKHRVMSSGVWQFNTEVKDLEGVIVGQDMIFNVKSKVKGQENGYPFTLERQDLRPFARKTLEEAMFDVLLAAAKQRITKHIEAYTKVKILSQTADNSITLVEPKDPVFTVNKGADGVPDVTFVRGVDRPIFYYNSTDKDYLAVPGAALLFSKLGTVYSDFIQHYTTEHDTKGSLYFAGIGFDRGNGKASSYDNGWGGLHFKRPYHSLWFNPAYEQRAQTPEQLAAMQVHVMMHEAMHINQSDHDAPAFYEMALMYMKLDSGKALEQFKIRLTNIYTQHWDTHVAISGLYNADDTATVGTAIKGNKWISRQSDIRTVERTLEDVRTREQRESSGDVSGSPWRNTSFEFDTSEHPNQRPFLNGLKNFVTDLPRLRRALRQTTNAVYHVLELQQLAHINPDIEELSLMNEQNGAYNRYKAKLQAQADAVLSQWKDLGKDNAAKLNKFLLAEVESKQLWFDLKQEIVTSITEPVGASTVLDAAGHKVPGQWKRYVYVPNSTTAEKALQYGLDEDTAALALSVKNTLLSQLNAAEMALLNLLGKRYVNAGPGVLTSAFIPVKRHIHELRKYPFFPQGRFGNRMLIIEQKKANGPGWEIVWKEHFEDAVEWEKAFATALQKADPLTTRVRKESLTDQHYVLMALPTDFVDLAASELGLTDKQLEIMMSILQPVKREIVLSSYDQQRLGIKGYSSDALRSFANFTWHNSNLLAKLIYRADFNMSIRGVGVKLREAKYSQDPDSIPLVEKLEQIKRYMEKTRDYVMAPPNEAQTLRAFVSIGYLGLNVKTALLNTYGLITTWSDLTDRFGQVEGMKLLSKASVGTFKSIKLTGLNERKAGGYLSTEAQEALDKAIEEGVLSQSYAYHLAGMANAGNLRRMEAYQTVGKAGQGLIDASMYIFRLTELSTRRATFLAQFEAARKQPNVSFQEAYTEAVNRTNKLQNDYSLGNRVPFMRGIKSDNGNPVGKLFEPVVPLATVFMSFAQHMAFHAYGGYELGERRMSTHLRETPRSRMGGYTMKIWIVTLLLAGYEGLPGAENLLDLLEVAWKKWGGTKPVRQEIREFVQEVEGFGTGISPQGFSRGMGHNVAGFDISRSVGFGRIVPGTDVLNHPKDSAEGQLGALVLDLAGPTGGFIKFGMNALMSNRSKAEAFEKLPGGAGNIYTAYRWSEHGVRAPTGSRVTFDLETGKLRDLTAFEIAGKYLGFNPTVVSHNREVRFNQFDRQVYWQTRRQELLQDLWTARWQKDREAEADAKKAVSEFNMGVPAEHKNLRLTGADIAKSMQVRQRNVRAEENQSTVQKRYRSVYEDVKKSYDRP